MSQFCFKLIVISVVFILASGSSYADEGIQQRVVHLVQTAQFLPLPQRIVQLSAALLNQPYELEALGEGVQGEYNQKPLYRLDSFDCETYVDTVLALALSSNFNNFQMWMNNIRYRHGQVSFETRNHFTSADWLPNNRRLGIIKDDTYEVAQQVTKVSSVYIDRQNWYRKLPLSRVIQVNKSTSLRMQQWHQLRGLAVTQQNVMAHINYIPLHWLLKHPTAIKRIPNGAIIFLVLEDPKIKKMLGTNNNISHMGFAIWKHDQLFLRAASIHAHRVIDVPLLAYLTKYLPGGMLQGISVWQAIE